MRIVKDPPSMPTVTASWKIVSRIFHSPKCSFQMLDRAADFVGCFARAHFPDEQAIARKKRNEPVEIDIPVKGG